LALSLSLTAVSANSAVPASLPPSSRIGCATSTALSPSSCRSILQPTTANTRAAAATSSPLLLSRIHSTATSHAKRMPQATSELALSGLPAWLPAFFTARSSPWSTSAALPRNRGSGDSILRIGPFNSRPAPPNAWGARLTGCLSHSQFPNSSGADTASAERPSTSAERPSTSRHAITPSAYTSSAAPASE
jgi:hypothetical protein